MDRKLKTISLTFSAHKLSENTSTTREDTERRNGEMVIRGVEEFPTSQSKNDECYVQISFPISTSMICSSVAADDPPNNESNNKLLMTGLVDALNDEFADRLGRTGRRVGRQAENGWELDGGERMDSIPRDTEGSESSACLSSEFSELKSRKRATVFSIQESEVVVDVDEKHGHWVSWG